MTISARAAVAAAVGTLLGLSSFAGGAYDFDQWGILAVTVAVVAIVVVAATSTLPRGWSALAPGALLALAAVQYGSTLWAEDREQALLAGHRTFLYAVALGLFITLFRDLRAPTWLLAGLVGGTAVVELRDLVLLLGGGDPGLFNRGRLDQPLGYVNGQAAAFAVALWPALGAAERAHRRSVAVLGIGVGSLGLSMVVLNPIARRPGSSRGLGGCDRCRPSPVASSASFCSQCCSAGSRLSGPG